MLRELVEFGNALREQGELPPVGYADYSAPIKWVLRLRSVNPPRVQLTPTELDLPRPDRGRTSGVFAYPLVDQGAYVLGRTMKADGKQDRKAEKKHVDFRTRLDELTATVEDESLIEAIHLLAETLDNGLLRKFPEIEKVAADEWVSIVVEEGPLKGKHLFEHKEVQRYWRRWLNNETLKDGYHGTCAITGKEAGLVKRIPGKGYLLKNASLISYNKNAYVSFVGGGGASKKTSIGICYEAADTANRTLEYLARSDRHSKILLDVRDSKGRRNCFASLKALYWIDKMVPVKIENKGQIDISDLLAPITAPITDDTLTVGLVATLTELRDLLNVPWKPKDRSLNLNDYTFYLAILSQYEVRVVVREFFSLNLNSLKEHLGAFLDAASLVSVYGGEVRPASLGEMLHHLYANPSEKGKKRGKVKKAGDPNLVRYLLRAAYRGQVLPSTLLPSVLDRFRRVLVKGDDEDKERPFREHALVALIKFILTFNTDDAMTLQRLDLSRNTRAYLSGRLLAVLEKIQQDAHQKKTNRSLTARYYGAVVTAPKSYFGTLLRTTTVAHLPKLPETKEERKAQNRKCWLRGTASSQIEKLMASLYEVGGIPFVLTLDEQADFALGYYHQRSDFFSSSSQNDSSSNNS